MFRNIGLDDTAKEYVVDCLRHGSKYANRLTSLSLRGVTAFLPKELDGLNINYSRSIQLTFGIRIYGAARSNVYEVVRLFLENGDRRIALIETYYRIGDLEKIVPLPRYVYSQDEIYFVLKPSQDVSEIKNAFSSARDYPFVCGLIDLSGVNLSLTDTQPILPNWWDILTNQTTHIIVNAFDDEGFLLADIER